MIKHINRILLLAAAMLLFTMVTSSCADETRLVKTAFKSGKVVMTFAGAPLTSMTEIPFTIEIAGDTGIAVNDAKLSISMDMPTMPMPPNRPVATWHEGAYRGAAIFTMAGAWQIIVNIQRPGYEQEQVVFDIDQVMMK